MSLTAFVLIALQEAREICEGQINVSVLSAACCGEGCSRFFSTAVIGHSDQKQLRERRVSFRL